MSNEIPSRNRYVLRRESGHPGYSNVVVLSTSSDLKKLADDIRKLAESGSGRLEHYVTEEKDPTSRGSVVFEVINEKGLGELQTGDLKYRITNKIGPVLVLGALALMIYGGYTAIVRLLGWLAA